MEIKVAKKAGFCFGVKRAIDITFNLAKEGNKGLYTYGPLIHNPQVVEELKRKGVNTVNDLNSPDIRTIIIRTHGVSPEVYAETSKMGYNVIDATCPFVKKAQNFTQILKDEGYQVLIIGNQQHPEVQGLIGFAGGDAVVADDVDQLPALKKKVGIIVQTTQSFDTFRDIVLHVICSAREVKIYNTICDFTAQRVRETRELAKKVDLMIIVGGKNSSNTNQLVKLSKDVCAKVYHIEVAGEIKKVWFSGVEKAGVTGGASTPQWIIDDVVKKIREISIRR
ncbi:MAG TPA: 4-hydroxy-3-methylbut-2-enyl diphosphate reductase [Nitrospirae bacterium]|nr:4-hydroxy-3-methylbut-2-enyl diphosphate reductase [bacterium BMS3Abin06]HDH13063.1 4-hydroxy-3-methylbut-2-enyl diphosphate reductase [Nitrospirota bacterium]HDZ01912.1 4-hydroxy-3-methylbut-2-enyl diphosphate reductase [Nitrospirota bacterium]